MNYFHFPILANDMFDNDIFVQRPTRTMTGNQMGSEDIFEYSPYDVTLAKWSLLNWHARSANTVEQNKSEDLYTLHDTGVRR